MEEKEFKNGLISEEALDEISGGIDVDRETLKKYVKKAGVAVLGVGAVATAVGGGYYGGKKLGLWGKSGTDEEPIVASGFNKIGPTVAGVPFTRRNVGKAKESPF